MTVVFQDGFQLKTVEELALDHERRRNEASQGDSPVSNPPSVDSQLNGMNTSEIAETPLAS